MAIDRKIKKEVMEDWQNAFPQLTLYSKDKLYKRIGPLIIGLELIKLPRTEEYRPHFVLYSLCGNKDGNDLKACLSYPILLKEYYNKKGFQYNIPYEKSSAFFIEALENIKKQTPLSFDGDIPVKTVIRVIDEYSKMPPLNAAPYSYLQATLQEAKLKIGLFSGIKEAQHILAQIDNSHWDKNSFNMWNVDLNEWLWGLQKTISNRDEFIMQIELNKQDKKIAQLKSSELID